MVHKLNQKQTSHDHLNRCRKSHDKSQDPFMVKALKKLVIERT
jgi:hypothetical protein